MPKIIKRNEKFNPVVKIKKGFSDCTLPENTADLVIINGVILILKNKRKY